jgi:ArsR family transcriptional regulator
MPTELTLAPKSKRAAGDVCCVPVALPEVSVKDADRLASTAKALGDPIRLQIIDVLRSHAGEVCVCELVPLFDISQPTLSHHLKKLRDAGLVDSVKRGLWSYYFVKPEALKEFESWLS